MQSLKASWEVRAGVVPGTPIPELTKRWHYTSDDREKDEQEEKAAYQCGTATGLAYHPRFAKLRIEAMDYHMQLSNPHNLNWAELTFVWY